LSSKPLAGCGHLGVSSVGGIWADPRPSGDGRSVYVIGDDALSQLRRDPRAGVLSPAAGKPSCIGWFDKRCLRLLDFHPSALALAPDGRSLYVASAQTDYAYGKDDEWTRLDVLRRDGRTGSLGPLHAPGSCFANPKQVTPPKPTGCTAARGLRLPQALVMSPDARFVYVASFGGISVYRRLASGGLEQLAGPAGCLLAAPGPGLCSPRPKGVGGTYGLTMSPDGRNVYALVQGSVRAQPYGDLLLAFARDPRTGALSSLGGVSGCLSGTARPDCRLVLGLTGWYWTTSMALSSDGRNLYFANGVEIVTLTRHADGTLEAQPRTSTLLRLGTWDPTTLQTTISPDGRSVYLVSPGGVQSYARDPGSGDLSAFHCLTAETQQGCERLRPIMFGKPESLAAASVNDVTVTADGRNVYIAAVLRSGTVYVTTYARAA
jgi:DNA-binding beta-propeller fold protein YncE